MESWNSLPSGRRSWVRLPTVELHMCWLHSLKSADLSMELSGRKVKLTFHPLRIQRLIFTVLYLKPGSTPTFVALRCWGVFTHFGMLWAIVLHRCLFVDSPMITSTHACLTFRSPWWSFSTFSLRQYITRFTVLQIYRCGINICKRAQRSHYLPFCMLFIRVIVCWLTPYGNSWQTSNI
jgi:hypothetical protein